MPTWPSKASHTASGEPRRSSSAWRPSCLSTARTWASAHPAFPSWPSSPGELGSPRLPHHRDPDLPGVGQLVLDLLRHVPGDHLCLDVVDPVRLDHDPDLPAGPHRADLLHGPPGRVAPLLPFQ